MMRFCLAIICAFCLLSCNSNKKSTLGLDQDSTEMDSTKLQQLEAAKYSDVLFGMPSKDYIMADGNTLYDEEKSLSVDINNDGKNELLIIGPDHGAGIKLAVRIDDKDHSLLISPKPAFYSKMFDMLNNLRVQYDMQISAVDLDGDGIKEIVTSYGDMEGESYSYVFYLTGENHTNVKMASGRIEGLKNCYLDNENRIVSPREDGPSYIFVYEKGAVRQISPKPRPRPVEVKPDSSSIDPVAESIADSLSGSH